MNPEQTPPGTVVTSVDGSLSRAVTEDVDLFKMLMLDHFVSWQLDTKLNKSFLCFTAGRVCLHDISHDVTLLDRSETSLNQKTHSLNGFMTFSLRSDDDTRRICQCFKTSSGSICSGSTFHESTSGGK